VAAVHQRSGVRQPRLCRFRGLADPGGPVHAGRENRSAKGPLGRRAANRQPSAGDGPDSAMWSFGGSGPMIADGLGQRPPGLAEILARASSSPFYTGAGEPAVGKSAPFSISWVTVKRWAREAAGPRGPLRGRPYRDDAESLTDAQLLDKLRDVGIELDRAGLEMSCRAALSAEEVASQLMDDHLSAAQRDTPEVDWVWLAVLTLWQRWWPAKPCLETVDDKIQEGYARMAQERGAATDLWLDAWSDVLHLCDAAGSPRSAVSTSGSRCLSRCSTGTRTWKWSWATQGSASLRSCTPGSPWARRSSGASLTAISRQGLTRRPSACRGSVAPGVRRDRGARPRRDRRVAATGKQRRLNIGGPRPYVGSTRLGLAWDSPACENRHRSSVGPTAALPCAINSCSCPRRHPRTAAGIARTP
jgi:hypothetical protein